MVKKVNDGSTYLTRIHHRESPLRILYNESDVAPVWTSEVVYQKMIGHPVEEVAIPQIIVDFHTALPNISIKTLHGNSRQIEEWLLDKTIDLGIVEGLTDNVAMKYESFMKDEIVLVTRAGNPQVREKALPPAALKNLEFVLREQGSGTNDIIRKALAGVGIEWQDLKVKVIMASTESIKSFLLRTDCFSFLSVHAITAELSKGELQVIDLKDFEILRDFYFVHPQGVIGRIPDTFRQFSIRRFSRKPGYQK